MVDNDQTETSKPTKLLDRLRDRIRLKHYSIRTEKQYVHWVKRFIYFHDKRHPQTMGVDEVTAFLTHLAVKGRVASATQNQALSALLFLYREVLEINLPWLDEVVRAKRPARLPVVLTRQEVVSVLDHMDGIHGLMARLLYGTGMRLMECMRLRVKDIDFECGEIMVRDGKGAKDRVTMLPNSLNDLLQQHLAARKRLYEADLAKGMASVYLPDALDRKYPSADIEWAWQYVFVAGSYSVDPISGVERRHHMDKRAASTGYEKGCACCQFDETGDHDDLYPCIEQRRPWRGFPFGCDVTDKDNGHAPSAFNSI